MIYLGADHGGYLLKEEIKKLLRDLAYDHEDLGAERLDPADDYPDFAAKVAERVSQNPETHRGILFCRSGVGMAIVANKFKGVRSAQVFTEEMAKKSREDDNANVLSLAADYLEPDEAKKIVKIWLETSFSGGERHKRRLGKIEELDK